MGWGGEEEEGWGGSSMQQDACCMMHNIEKTNKGVAAAAAAAETGRDRQRWRERCIPGKMLGAAVAVPLRPASAAETESSAQSLSLSRACLLVGRDALVAGCLDWALLTRAEVGWAPHMHAATEERGDVSEWFLPNCFSP